MLLVNMENKQTAVEWFIDNLKPLYPNIEEFKLIIGLAKDMEKEQIEKAFDNGVYVGTYAVDKDGEEYYKETYKQQENERRK